MAQLEPEVFSRLPGEDQSLAPEDAGHWIRVYRELIKFCELGLAQLEPDLETGQLRRRLVHYHSRLRHWQKERARAR